ncbi:MAG: redoxin domain-containing protein [Pseudohongiella sp.]|nr:redoxin domain-containing protein [Pseudohongiella sp.]
MKRNYNLFLLMVLTFFTTSTQALPERIGDFALLDLSGNFHQISRYQHRKAVVLMSYEDSCPNMDAQLANYSHLATHFADEDIEFLLITTSNSSNTIHNIPILLDETQLVSESLGIEKAGDVRVLAPQRLSLLYKGAVTATLQQVLSSVESSANETVYGENLGACVISYPAQEYYKANPPDYARDIAPLVIDKCVECHHPDGVGPFAMENYLFLLGWSPMIREVLMNRRMPPTQVDEARGYSPDSRQLRSEQLQMLIHWINSGAPRGNSEQDPLAEHVQQNNEQWLIGEPDYIVTAPSHSVPATGILDYQYETIDLNFKEDRWVQAVQFQPGNHKVLHHLMAYVTPPDEDFWGPERNGAPVNRRFLDSYVPGAARVREFQPGTAVLIPAGHRLALQFHYMSYGVEVVDQTRIGLYFADTPLEPLEVETLALPVTDFVLPPRVEHFPLQAEHLFDEAVVITGVRARMNTRGKSMRFSAIFPDGTAHSMLSVPSYNYAWQAHYTLDAPVQLPAGSRVVVSGAFDNSISNPTNPDPNREVRAGFQTRDEVFIGYFTYHRAE